MMVFCGVALLVVAAALPSARACAGARGEGLYGTAEENAGNCGQVTGVDTCVERCGCLWTQPTAGQDCTYHPSGNPCCTFVSPWIYPDPNTTNIAKLTSTGTPLKRNDTIAFFGDSITWLNSYLNHFRELLAAGEGTSGLGVHLLNFGINGVKIIGLANGTHNVTSSDQCRLNCPPGQEGRIVEYTYTGFASMLSLAKPRVAVVQVGINDVWFPGGTGPTRAVANAQEYATVLQTEFVQPAARLGVKLVLASVTTIGELKAGTNSYDTTLDSFQAAAKQAAAEASIPFVDLRRAYTEFETLVNVSSRHQSTWPHAGILTYDGVHPATDGDKMLVEQHAGGLLAALA